MARFYGAVGYIVETNTALDVWENKPVERMYKGDLNKIYHRLENGTDINDDVTISNEISILADAYALNHMHAIRYVKWRGTAWKITNIRDEPPRLILSLGGVYNGETAE